MRPPADSCSRLRCRTLQTNKKPSLSALHKMPSPQVASPITMSPSQRNNLRLMTSHDLYDSLNVTLKSADNRPATPVRRIQEDGYTVPAPPPPSPVSFRGDHWHAPARR